MPIRESPSGAISTTVDPFTAIDHSFGAMNVAPPAVVCGVSLVSFWGAELTVAAGVGEGG
jgi:hypothetical protein